MTIITSFISLLFFLPLPSDFVFGKPASFGTMNADNSVNKHINLDADVSFRMKALIFFLPFYLCTFYYLTTI